MQHDPVAGKKKAPSAVSESASTGAKVAGFASSSTGTSTVALRVNNNQIQNLNDFDEALAGIFDNPTQLQWIDLSGNALTKITENVFESYPSITTLHLHGNALSRYSDIDHLAKCLPRLHSLTLHGNPLEEKKHYRNYVISAIPSLMQLDFSSVTPGDREKAVTWAKIYEKALNSPRKIRGGPKHGGVMDDNGY